jgi:DNA uptake protein ComE-like DNA-binding protein
MKWLLILAVTLVVSGSAAADQDSRAKTPAQSPSAELTALARNLPSPQGERLMAIVNRGTLQDLVSLPGIGAVRAAAIVAGRPYRAPLDLLRVRGIGEVTLAAILKHARAGFPTPQKP